MIYVRILQSIAGHAEPLYDLEDFAFQPGEIVGLHGELATKWIAGGIAEAVLEKTGSKKETAMRDIPEKEEDLMAILSLGTALTDDVEAGLHLTEIVNPAVQDGAMITLVVKAAESHIKLETGRNFEQIVYVDEPYDIAPNTPEVLLTDRPVVSIQAIKEVTGRNTDGTPVTRTLGASEYVVNRSTGILSKVSGSFISGKQVLLVSWTGGYAAADITASANNEIRVLKQLCLSILQNWHTKRKDGIGHYTTLSAPGESVSINFDFTPDEVRMINQLRI